MALEIEIVSNGKWKIIQNGSIVGTVTFDDNGTKNVFSEITTYAPKNKQTGAGWSPGPIPFKEWFKKTINELFGESSATTILPNRGSVDAIDYFAEYKIPMGS